MQGASGVGHVNFADNMDVPVFVGSGESTVPAFPLELLRVARGVERGSVFYDGRTVAMKKRNADVTFPRMRMVRSSCSIQAGSVRLRPIALLMLFSGTKRRNRIVRRRCRFSDCGIRLCLSALLLRGGARCLPRRSIPDIPPSECTPHSLTTHSSLAFCTRSRVHGWWYSACSSVSGVAHQCCSSVLLSTSWSLSPRS